MVFKRKAVEINSHTKKMTQDTRKRKTKIKRKLDKFILDQQGESKPTVTLSVKRIMSEDTLGHDPLIQKER